MKLKTIKSVKNLKNKTVLLRVDFNVPLTKSGKVANDRRIKAAVPTIKYLLGKKAKVVILSHLGRPKGQIVAKYSNKPIAAKLGQILAKKVAFCGENIGAKAKEAVSEIKAGQILMLENVRFNKAEEKNDKNFAKTLAALGDIYVNDAFSVSHRNNASVETITKFLPSYAGLLMEKEVINLNKVLESKAHPKVAIIGGAKLETKVKVIKNLLKRVDYVLVGGAIANNFFKAMDYEVGKSLVDDEYVGIARNLINEKLILPVDVITAKNLLPKSKSETKPIGQLSSSDIILDIGPATVKIFTDIIKSAKLIVWNGPMGYFELPQYKKASQGILKAISSSKAFKVIGGGETLQLTEKIKLNNSFISTGGGAMLEFLEGKVLPALRPLIKK